MLDACKYSEESPPQNKACAHTAIRSNHIRSREEMMRMHHFCVSVCPPLQTSIEAIHTSDLEGAFDALKITKILGRGRTGGVYEVGGKHMGKNRGVVGKFYTGNDDNGKRSKREAQLATWAHSRGVGPQILDVMHGDMRTKASLHTHPISVLLMEKMDMSLSRVVDHSYSLARQSWGATFTLISSADMSIVENEIALFCRSGWLCSDDMKPDNVLINADSCSVKPSSVVFTDWDPDHWHVVPLPSHCGMLLNKLTLIINTVLCHYSTSGGNAWLVTTINLWPDNETAILHALSILSGRQDKQLMKFLRTYTKFLSRGAFYYANVRKVDKKGRAEEFARVFHAICTEVFDFKSEPSEKDVDHMRCSLRELRVQYVRGSLMWHTQDERTH